MQLSFSQILRIGPGALLLTAVLGAQSAEPVRRIAHLASHEVEIAQGCNDKPGAPPLKLALSPGQPLPIPLPISCAASNFKVTRLRLSLPARTEPGVDTSGGSPVVLDAPFTIGYDLAAEWTGGLNASIAISSSIAGVRPVSGACSNSLNANLSTQTARVCEWSSAPRREEGFTVESEFRFAPIAAAASNSGSSSAPQWQLRSTARYAWIAAPAIERVEFVQAVQSLDQRVPLWASKPTFLRIFPAGAGALPTRVQVQVRSGAGLWRYTTPRSAIAPERIDRASDAQSFIVPLPEEATAVGTISVEAALQTAEGRLLTAMARPAAAEFVEAPRAPALAYVPVCETSADGRERICPNGTTGSQQVLGAMLEQILPVAALAQSATGEALIPGDALGRLARVRLLLDELQPGPATIVAAVLPSAGEWAGRLAGRWSIGLRMAFVSDGASGPEQLTRALAGLLGVKPSGMADVGVDLRSGTITPADQPDLSGAAGSWASAGTVTALAANLRARPVESSLPGGVSEYLSLPLRLARDGRSGSLGHAFRSSSAVRTAPSDPAALTCVSLTAAGDETARYCFTVEPLDEMAAEDSFALRMPWLAGARQITLAHDGVALATRTLSATPPRAEFLTPLVGTRVPGGPLLVQWAGSDTDGDSLRYDLLVSTDGAGLAWTPVACDLDRTDFTIDGSLLPGGTRVFLQLRYSDGMQSSAAMTGPIELTGTGQLQAPANFALAPMPAGQTAEVWLTVNNSGNAPLLIQSAASSNPAVQLAAPGLPAAAPPGGSLPLRIRVTPPSLGAFAATLAIEGPAAAARVQVSGRGVNARTPQLEILPAALDFGTVALTQSRELGFSIGNGGGAPLTVTIPRTPPGFRISGADGSVTLAPGGQLPVSVRFSPVGLGSAFETLPIESDDPARRTAAVAMSGHAIELVVVNAPKIDIRPAPSADFGNVRMGVPSQQTFTVRNSGRAPLIVTRVSTTLADYSVRDFPALPFTLAPNAEQIFAVRIDATATGARLGTLQIVSNDPAAPQLNIGLSAVASLPLTGTVVLQLDDGIFERQAGFPSGDGYFLSRLKPPAYPATLKAIRVYFGERSLNPADGFGLIWAAHPAGTEELGALRLQSRFASVQNPAEWVEYAVTPMTVESGDLLVGFTAPTNAALQPAALDISTNLMPTRSYASRDGGTWRQSVLWPGFPSGVFAVRAVVDLGVRAGN